MDGPWSRSHLPTLLHNQPLEQFRILRDQLEQLRRCLRDLLKEDRQRRRIISDHLSDMCELRRADQGRQHRGVQAWHSAGAGCSRRSGGHRGSCVCAWGRADRHRWDSVDQVLHCSFGVVKGRSEGAHDFLPAEAHAHQILDRLFILLASDEAIAASGASAAGRGSGRHRAGGGGGGDGNSGSGGFGDLDGLRGFFWGFRFLSRFLRVPSE